MSDTAKERFERFKDEYYNVHCMDAGQAISFEAGYEAAQADARAPMGKLVEALLLVKPIAVVQGDMAQHTNPHAKLMLNSSCAWLVTEADKSAHKHRESIKRVNEALTKAQAFMEGKS